ncbi:MAG: NAD(P)/FAD-dependent oxidoreductase, partial [Spirochaetales bacterium]
MYDVVIIGSGPAGYSAALRAGQLGFKTALVDRGPVGGMCVNWGCVPMISFMESARLFRRLKDSDMLGITGIDYSRVGLDLKKVVLRASAVAGEVRAAVTAMLKRLAVDIIAGEAGITDAETVVAGGRILKTSFVLIGTGSVPLPFNPDPALRKALGGAEIVELKNLFGRTDMKESLAVWGGTPSALEIAQFFALSGRRVVLLYPEEGFSAGMDRDVLSGLLPVLEKDGVRFMPVGEYLKNP